MKETAKIKEAAKDEGNGEKRRNIRGCRNGEG